MTAEKLKKGGKMSSNIRLKKICQHCHQSFIAKTTVTKFCSDDCAKRNYKKRSKEKKVTEAILNENHRIGSTCSEEAAIKLMPPTALDRLKREWLNMEDLSLLLGITQRTLFRAMKRDGFPKVKIGRRVLFNKQQVENYFNSKYERV